MICCSPETGQHVEYAGSITHYSNEQIKAITTCIYGWWRLYGYNLLRKANFSLLQRNIFYLTIMVVETLRMVPPSQCQLKLIINPTKLIWSDEIKSIIQVPDTQDVHNRGHG